MISQNSLSFNQKLFTFNTMMLISIFFMCIISQFTYSVSQNKKEKSTLEDIEKNAKNQNRNIKENQNINIKENQNTNIKENQNINIKENQNINIKENQNINIKELNENWFENYLDFYNKTLDEITTFSKKNAKFVVFRAVDGLGNRLMGLVASFLFSILTDRIFIIDWPYQDGHITQVYDLMKQPLFNWDFDSVANFYDEKEIYQTAAYFDFADHEDMSLFLCEDFQTKLDKYQFIFMRTNNYFSPAMMNNKFFIKKLESKFTQKQIHSMFSTLGNKIIIPIDSIQAKVDDFVEKNHFHSPGKYPIGIHLRNLYIHSSLNNSWIWSCANSILENKIQENPEMQNLEPIWFISTDNIKDKKEAKANYPDRFLSRDIILDRNSIEGNQESFVDMLLLSHCNDILTLYARSSFTYVSHGLADINPYVKKCNHLPSSEPCFHGFRQLSKTQCFESTIINNLRTECS
ncbi:fucosyltransferase cazy family gt37-like protein [Anaeramoeba ignava]|uniref:Fucosyltransferase cazy family gt37-like protein n=1 Tax=Anaeramoeba ignava TaxID=1746090 RepID=A0A9Q0RA14_ANAIG|nr:fucosyltransferase cazy family gt37-like protein [Anaeramoeba ignava]